MKPGVFLCLALLLSCVSSESLQLYSVSSSPTQIISPQGSVRGGTAIFINGVGFDTSAANNVVTVGPYPCIVPAKGASPTILSCVTSDTKQKSDIYNLPIIVTVNGQQQSLTNEQGCFSYVNAKTPLIQELFPASSDANTLVNFYGVHRIIYLGDGSRDMGDVISMKIGDTLCGRFDIAQANITANYGESISCRQASVQRGGKYLVQEYLTPGYSTADPRLRRSSLLPQAYHYAVLPAIKSFSPNSGSLAGQKLSIQGTGFSTVSSEITVTVDGTPCNILSSTQTSITCDLQARTSASSLLPTNSTSQVNGYISGAGLNYKRFDISNLATKTNAGLRAAVKANSPSLVLQQSSYRGQIKTGTYYGSNYGQVFTGYFTAPVSGRYVFRGVADDTFAVYLSSTYGSAESASTPLIYSDSYQNYGNFYIVYYPTAQGAVDLQAGKSYYIEVYHINLGGSGFLRVSVQVPNSDTSLLWQTHAVQRLDLTYTNDPQILNFTLTGATSGQVNLTFVVKPVGLPSYTLWAVVNFDASISQFLTALGSLELFSTYSISGDRFTYDSSGQPSASNINTYSWIISVKYQRTSLHTKAVFSAKNIGGSGTMTLATIKTHGPTISGAFTLTLGQYIIQYAGSNLLRSSIPPSDLQSALRSISGFELVEVNLLSISSYMAYGASWLISFIGYNGPLPLFDVDNTNLFGGASGTTPKITATEIRAYSSDILVGAIDYPFLSTPSSSYNVLIKVNGVPSVCVGSCTYTYLAASPQLTSTSISSSDLTLSLTDPASINYSLQDTTITFAGQPCTITNTASPINNFDCSLPVNTDLTPIITAGSYIPIVTVTQVGLVPATPSVNALTFPLNLITLSSTSGGTNGGYSIIIQGAGFPLLSQTATITICGKTATIQSISNIQAKIIVPECATQGATQVTISDGVRISNSLTFTYIAPTPTSFIYSVIPQTYNPTLKGIMEIIGAGFGTDINGIRVDLANSSGKVYKMRILKLNDTYIKVGIPGGLAGKYKVQVNMIGVGEALPSSSTVNDFTYELVITSVTPATGSYNGGTLLDISGINFSTAIDETLVFIGDELNWNCNVQSVNQTNIKCRTPPINQYYKTSDAQTVTLTNRLMADNTCQGVCTFSYLDLTASPSLSSISSKTIVTGSIILTGDNLGASPKVVLTNMNTSKVTIVNPNSASNVLVNFTVPSVEAGFYDVKVRADPIGESNSYLLVVNAHITAKSPASLSTQGGMFTITGTGLPQTWPNPNWILTYSKNKVSAQYEVLSTSATSIVFNIPACSDKDLFNATFTTPTNNVVGMTITALAASTPAISLTTAATVAAGTNSFSFTQTTLTTAIPDYVVVFSAYNPSESYKYSVTASAGTVQFSASLSGGKYGFRFYYTSYGWSNCPSTVTVTIASPTAPSLQGSYNGGSFVLSGANLSPSGTVKINGVKTRLTNINAGSAIAIIPPFVTPSTQAKFGLVEPSKLTGDQYQIFSDNPAEQAKAFDNLFGTIYTSPSTGKCFIGIDVGSDLLLELTRIRFFPNSRWAIASKYLVGATFQASNDNSSWTTIKTIDATVRSGWNILPFSLPNKYRYYRFAHNENSQCSLAEIEITGVIHSSKVFSDFTTNPSQIIYEDGGNTFTLANSIEFREDKTPIVNTLSKLNGDVFGGYSLTLTGTNLNFDTPTVTIDGIPCVVTASSFTQITCTVGSRLSLPKQNTFVVLVGTSTAILKETFSYVMRWSDIRTWGTDMPPIDNDLVFVPKGMNLLVDQSTPKLQGILVENGTLTFSDEIDMEIHAGFITVDGGKFIAGTQEKPYNKKLTFVLYGGYYSPQQPMFGNKGIGCMECFISIHGEVRSYTWSMLESSIAISQNSFTVQDPVDWRVGQEIVVASTSFNHNQAERRIITAISGKTITVDTPFKYTHFAGVQTYGSKDKIEMRAEVGLLTRNIKVMGDETSEKQSYGAHLMMAGSAQNGLVGQIAYTEFTKCGQPRIIGRYCIHYHMNGDVTQSFARGNAVHDSMARVITLHGVHYLTVEYNVGYNVKGHNFFIEDGIETHNLLQYNLAISSIQVWTMLQTDISVASFWITNPTNHFRFNHAAGSDFYGFWYEIKANPDGPSACGDVCPIGNPLGDCHDNVAHSNVRFGLRIFKLAPRTYPCQALHSMDTIDPWAANPGVVGVFANYTLYKNGQSGLLAEQTAYLIFENITSAENKRSGAEFWISYFGKDPTVFRNSVIIGQTKTNGPQSIPLGRGIITPREGNIRIDNIRFYNFPANTHSIETCANCDNPLLFTNTAQEVYISNITFTDVNGYKLFMKGLKRQILYDLDGTFTTTAFDGIQRQLAAVVFNYPHLASDPACLPTSSPSSWDNTIACDQSVKLVRVTFNHAEPESLFSLTGLKAQPLSDHTALVPQNSKSFSQIYSFFSMQNKMDSMKSLKKTYAMPYISGRIYNIWWLTGLDFDHLSVYSSYYMKPTDPSIIFKFNYTLNRELYEIQPSRPNLSLGTSNLLTPTKTYLDTSCGNGEYYHDNTAGSRTLELCASAKNKTYFETTDVVAVYCRYLCPAPPGEFVKQKFVRYWSEPSQWPQGRLPLPGQNVTVNGNWTIIMDIDPAPIEFLTIDGDVIIQDVDRNITCNSIWIRAGSLSAGNASVPFQNKLTIQINGNKNDPGYVFDDSLVGGKIFVVTGKLNLYGIAPATVSTKLTKIALAGDTSIQVSSVSGWNIGDEIGLAPSFFKSRQYEKLKITGISGNVVSFTPALLYDHYGDASVTINNAYGTLDTRASVGHITRNIKIVSGPDAGWGYSVVIYQMWEGVKERSGQATFSGVEFTLGGQYDQEAASLVLYNNYGASTPNTIVTGSSFSDCRSFCLRGFRHNGATIKNNFFFQARKFHMKLFQVTSFDIDNNLMIGAIVRPTMTGKQPVACIQVTQVDPLNDNIYIKNSVCQGSDVNAYVLPFISCSQIDNSPFVNNLAGTALEVGFLLVRGNSELCLAFSGVRAYACKVGHISQPAGTAELQLKNYIIADTKLGVSLRFGMEGTDRTATFSDSYFTQISRPTCTICYGSTKISCSGSSAIRALAVTINGETYPKSFTSSFDGLCKQETFDSKAYIKNVVFDSYRQSYSQANLAQCSKNVILTTNPGAPDFVGGHYFWDSSCVNCQLEAMAFFDPPKQSELGWFGGCGNITCTGKKNYFMMDHTGTLFPGGGVLLANNKEIGDNTANCTYIPEINGHHCKRGDFAALSYESIAPDFNTRIMWPVNLTFDGGNWTTVTNGFKQWQWTGSQPLNKRLARFISVLLLSKTYNMTFASNPPDDMRLMLQKRAPGGNNAEWIIVKLFYPFPNSIQVSVNGQVKKPISLLANNGQDPLDTSVCGSNKFFYKNYTIHFVITNSKDCLIRVRLTNAVQLTLRFSVDINSFFSTQGPTRLVDRICAIFSINDQSRVKIVGVYNGSTQVILQISTDNNGSTTSNSTDTQSMIDLNNKVQASYSSGQLTSGLSSGANGLPLIAMSSQLLPVRPISDSSPDDTEKKIVIGVSVSIAAVIIIVAAIIIYIKKTANNKVTSDQIPQFSSQASDKAKSNEKPVHQTIQVQNITEENISEVIFDKHN